MAATFACIAGGPVCRAMESGALKARALDSAGTPFGEPEAIYLVDDAPAPFYLALRQQPGHTRVAPSGFNYRATLYALKDLGVRGVLSWSAAGAIKHNISIGHVVVPDDVIDLTRCRATSFFERAGLGLLRQFPVFCPALRQAATAVLDELDLHAHVGGTAVATEGPRLETPAEIRMLASYGADLVTHHLVPEVFLAKELQMCLAGACYVVNYAETGSRHRPFITGDLFGGLTEVSMADRLEHVSQALPDVLRRIAQRCAAREGTCECERTMAANIAEHNLPDDWRRWFD